jgi:hypothetical protein
MNYYGPGQHALVGSDRHSCPTTPLVVEEGILMVEMNHQHSGRIQPSKGLVEQCTLEARDSKYPKVRCGKAPVLVTVHKDRDGTRVSGLEKILTCSDKNHP